MIGFSSEDVAAKEQTPYPEGYSNVQVTATLKGVSLSYVTRDNNFDMAGFLTAKGIAL